MNTLHLKIDTGRHEVQYRHYYMIHSSILVSKGNIDDDIIHHVKMATEFTSQTDLGPQIFRDYLFDNLPRRYRMQDDGRQTFSRIPVESSYELTCGKKSIVLKRVYPDEQTLFSENL